MNVVRINFSGIPLFVEIRQGVVLSVSFKSISSQQGDASLLDKITAFVHGDHDVLKLSFVKAQKNIRPILLKALEIPFGRVVSYGELSRAVFGSESHSRFVGYAMGKNPMPVVVPCHRVVFSDGKFNGFSAPLTIKKNLLLNEGIEIKDGKIDKTFFTHF